MPHIPWQAAGLALLWVAAVGVTSVDCQEVRDSAGVRIVEHASIPSSLPVWNLEVTPAVSIGAIQGQGPEIFGRLSNVLWRSDGAIVMVDAQVLEIRVFAASGGHLWTAGRAGGGPGEFNRLNSLWLLPGDSLLAVDGRRLSVFDPSGAYVRELTLSSPAPQALGPPIVTGVLANGTMVSTLGVFDASAGDGYYRSWNSHAFLDREGSIRTVLGTFPGNEGTRRSASGVLPETGEPFNATAYASTQMNRRTVVATAGNRVVIGDQARFEILYFGFDGSPEMIVRVTTPARPLDRRRYDAYHQNRSCPPVGCWQDNALPETLPAFGRMIQDVEGRLWVEEFVPEYEEGLPERYSGWPDEQDP
jgi:hypothetical protein